MLNPWAAPLMMSSASVIAMRTWLMIPAGGRSSDWQRREAQRMVGEKLDAVRESQAEAMSLAIRMWFTPWSVWGPMAGPDVHRAMAVATDPIVAPFARRADANVRRLQARAMAPLLAPEAMLDALAAPPKRARRRAK